MGDLLTMWVLMGSGVAGLGLLALALSRGRRKQEDRMVDIHVVAEELGLQVVSAMTKLDGMVLEGTVRGMHVRVEYRARWDGAYLTHVSVMPARAIPVLLSIRGALRRPLPEVAERVYTGDVSFDTRVVVHGDARAVLAMLGAEQRTRVANAVEQWGVYVHEGRLHMSHAGVVTKSVTINVTLTRIKPVATALASAPDSFEQGLAANVARDPLPLVRCRNLEALLELTPSGHLTLEAVWAALEDGSPLLRLLAAVHLMRPLDGGEAAIPFPPSMAGYRDSPALAVQEVAELALGELLCTLPTAPPEEAAATARLVGLHADSSAEEALLTLLELQEAVSVRLAAVEALGRIGTEKCIPALRAQRNDIHDGEAMWTACREALRRVRARYTREV